MGRTAAAPIIAVGGAAELVPARIGNKTVLRPDHASVANAAGAAIALVSGQAELVTPTAQRREAIEQATEAAIVQAIAAGADAAEVRIVQISEVQLNYVAVPSTRLRVKAAGILRTRARDRIGTH
ncbi:hypothetical protein [Arthrobacter sp. 24S4-2]|uniref:hypothetical protein n=1 Tax=Arthrobacter sp. 24S4-2 TaxID=2575374 RepID=UPI001C2FCA63|nr:hypothetical protein [Arthrobacter sp. 24S4-2]